MIISIAIAYLSTHEFKPVEGKDFKSASDLIKSCRRVIKNFYF